MSRLLDEFLEKTVLLDEDRKSLKEKRGFSDEVIDVALLRSARKENEGVILGLIKDYGAASCMSAGLIFVKDGAPLPSIKLLERNIIIPYIVEGSCVAVRPHKNFVKGKELSIFYADKEYDEDATTILTEGEFKAVAATMYGYQAIAVPGISSFVGDKQAGKKFIEFYEDLQLAGIRDLVILFDNENKADPKLPKFKEEVDKRFDTQYYSYLMAKKINEYGADVEASICWIPDEFRNKDGKADIDGLLASGVTEERFDEIIEARMDEEAFLNSLPQDAQDVIRSKLVRREERVKFAVRNGCYYIVVTDAKTGKSDEVQVSNFTLKYRATHIDEEGQCKYEFYIINDEKQSCLINFDGKDFADQKNFRKTLASHGKYIWQASSRDLDSLFSDIVPAEMKVVELRRSVGWDDELGIYFFDNCALDSSGGVVPLSEDGDVKVGTKYYKMEPSEARPIVNYSIESKSSGWNLDGVREIAHKLSNNFGTLAMYDVVSWFVAAVYKPWLFPVNRTFPLLGVFGRKNCGKTRLLQWMMSLFYENPEAVSFESSSKPGLRNQATLLQYLPVWLDEFRNDQRGKTYLDMLRGIYDHNRILISSASVGENKAFKLRSSLIISGEHIPADETGALNQRMITVKLPDKPLGKEFEWFEMRYHTFGGILPFLLKSRTKYLDMIKAAYFQRLESYRKKSNVEQRIAINYALIHAVSEKILGMDKVALESEMEESFDDIHKDNLETDPVLQMLVCCLRYHKAKNIIADIECAIDVRFDSSNEAVIYFGLSSCVDFYNEILRRQGKSTLLSLQLRRDLKSHPWVKDESRNVRIRSKQVKCYTAYLGKSPTLLIPEAFNFATDDVKVQLKRLFGGDNGPLSVDSEVLDDATDVI